MNIVDKIGEIHQIIEEIRTEEEDVARILNEGFGLSLNILKAVIEYEGKRKFDVSEHLEIISKIMGFDLEELVETILERKAGEVGNPDKQADKDTLDFITATSQEDLDDYEKFLLQSKAKENLEFLSKEL